MGVTLYQMVYGILPFWPPSGNHHELEIIIKHRELTFPVTADAVSSSAAAAVTLDGSTTAAARTGWDTEGGGGGVDGDGGGEGGRKKGNSGSGVNLDTPERADRALSGALDPVLSAHDPMSGYLRVRETTVGSPLEGTLM